MLSRIFTALTVFFIPVAVFSENIPKELMRSLQAQQQLSMAAGGEIPTAGVSTVVRSLKRDTDSTELSRLNEINKQKGKLVQITIEAIEVKNNFARDLGIKWMDTIGLGETARTEEGRDPATIPELPSIFRIGEITRLAAIRADIKLLMDKSAARLLANPKLVTKTETNADFLVGGEVPYIIITADGPNVEWKEYGVKMNIVPTILTDEKDGIGLSVFIEVSDLDWTNGAIYQNIKVPAVVTRNTANSVNMKSGETLTMAGLIRNFREQQTIGIPLLMDIPILGYLFSYKRWVENKTTVVIFITPTIVKDVLPMETKPE